MVARRKSASRGGNGVVLADTNGRDLGAWTKAQRLKWVHVTPIEGRRSKNGAPLHYFRCCCPVEKVMVPEGEDFVECGKECADTDDPSTRFKQHVLQKHDPEESWAFDGDEARCTPAMLLYPNATRKMREKNLTTYVRVAETRLGAAEFLFAQGFDPDNETDLAWLRSVYSGSTSTSHVNVGRVIEHTNVGTDDPVRSRTARSPQSETASSAAPLALRRTRHSSAPVTTTVELPRARPAPPASRSQAVIVAAGPERRVTRSNRA